MPVYILRIRLECRSDEYDSGILGVFSTYGKAQRYAESQYSPMEDGLVVWTIDSFEVDIRICAHSGI